MLFNQREVWVEPAYPFTGSPPFPGWGAMEYIAIHYPGGGKKDPVPIQEMRSMQRDYKTNRGYNLGYGWVIFPDGSVWESRGFDYKNAANNGDKDEVTNGQNMNNISFSIMIYVYQQAAANDLQIASVQAIVDYAFEQKGWEIPLRPHSYSDSTSCPGSGILDQLNAGVFLPVDNPIPPVGDMAKVTVFQNPEFQLAEFIAMCDDNGNALEVKWIRTARDQAVRDAHIGAGAKIDRGDCTKGRFKNCRLLGPVPTGDSKYAWTEDDFWYIVPGG